MPYIAIAAVLAVLAGLVIGIAGISRIHASSASLGGRGPGADINSTNSAGSNSIVSNIVKLKMSMDEIRSKLIGLSWSIPPIFLSEGAMCYKTARPLDRVEYVCPICGEKTLYTNRKAWFLDNELLYCRSLVDGLTNRIDIALDESEFCMKCGNTNENPQLNMVIQYKGESNAVTKRDISADDLKLVSEFLNGKDRHTAETGTETPLKNHIGRLEELLGVSLKN